MMEQKLRKNQNTLRISGLAVMVFGFWSIAKFIIYSATAQGGFQETLGLGGTYGLPDGFVIGVYVFLFALDLGSRFLVGFSARAEGRGKKKGGFYLVVTVILAFVSLSGIVIILFNYFSGVETPGVAIDSVFDLIVAALLEATSLYALAEVFVSAVTSRKIKNKLASESG